MCSTSLGYSFREDHELDWEANDPLPAAVREWLKGRQQCFSLGGTTRQAPQEEMIGSYREAAAFLTEFQAAFPEMERFAIVREWNCHAERSVGQVYRTPEALLADAELIAAGEAASSLPYEDPYPVSGYEPQNYTILELL